MMEFVNVQKRYGARIALDIPTLSIDASERLAVIGPNGSGKSTLLRLFAGVLAPDGGTIDRGNLSRGDIGYLPQKPYAFDMSVLKNVELALEGERDKTRLAQEALERVGLLHLCKARANRLSGGETQRMALARVLAKPRKLLLLDEPTASADIAAIELIERAILDYVSQTGCALVFSSHAPSQAMRLSTRVLALDGGRIEELGDTAQVLLDPQAESTRVFLKSWRL
ncbi:MAG TPA: ABC transporter ATP-binding protein [Clostridia bacterium]|nr:ABC transporter ATP-binding protein [Clostridia bacterium]